MGQLTAPGSSAWNQKGPTPNNGSMVDVNHATAVEFGPGYGEVHSCERRPQPSPLVRANSRSLSARSAVDCRSARKPKADD
jgi:hypothetical protein